MMIEFCRRASRRGCGFVLALFACVLSVSLHASTGKSTSTTDRSIAFYHTHTGERLDVVYFSNGQYRESALQQINHFLRDFRTGDMAEVDPKTLDIVHDVQKKAGYQGEVHIVSAYRSEKTNEMLRGKSASSGVAKKSQHIEAKAIDFRFPGVDSARIRDIARALQRGGVGYYRQSDFVHVDSGRVRYW
jgi:uncharacterized protein YcbK (DUF882 family)